MEAGREGGGVRFGLLEVIGNHINEAAAGDISVFFIRK